MEVPPTRRGRVAVAPEVELYYELWDVPVEPRVDTELPFDKAAPPPEPARVLLIMGVAATCTGWHTQVQALVSRAAALGRPLQVVAFDNRGVGRSSCPHDRAHYSSGTMAGDAAALMDRLGWPAAHVVGFSMGSQIAAKLAASIATDRVLSLTMVGAAAGGLRALPRSFHAVRHSLRVMTARSLVARARADLRLHFTKLTLHSASSTASSSAASAALAEVAIMAAAAEAEAAAANAAANADGCAGSSGPLPPVAELSPAHALCPLSTSGGGAVEAAAATMMTAPSPASTPRRQKDDLIEEYVAHARLSPPQPRHGLHGQLHAVWRHRLAPEEKAALASGRFPVTFVHGIKDKVAPPAYAQRLATRLGARVVLLPGAHVVMRESAEEFNAVLMDIVFGDRPAKPPTRVVPPIPVNAISRVRSAAELAASAVRAAAGAAAAAAAAAASSSHPPAAAAAAAAAAAGAGAAAAGEGAKGGPRAAAAGGAKQRGGRGPLVAVTAAGRTRGTT